MSIVRMRKVFRNKMRAKIGKKHYSLPSPAEAIFYVIILIFVAGAYYTFGGPSRIRSQQMEEGQGQGRVTAVVARVNGEKIPRALFEANIQMRMDRSERDITQERYLKSGTLSGLIDAFLLRQAARKENVKVSRADINKKVDEQVETTLSTKFPEKKNLRRFLKKQGQTLEQYKSELRREIAKDQEGLREQIAQDKLKELVEKRVAMTDDELKDSYTEVKASHILIDPKKEAECAKTAAPKGPAPDGDALAKAKAEKLLAEAKAGGKFEDLARKNSTCPSAAKGGDLGWFKKDAMAKEFSEAAFKMQPGQISDVVKTDFGYHIIKVTGRRTNLPKDFEKNKNTYREQALSERKYRAWNDYQEQLKKQAQIVVDDPELRAYRLMDEGKEAEARAALEQAVKDNPSNLSALWELAGIYERGGDKKQAVSLLEKITLVPEGAQTPSVHVKLGELYEAIGQKDKAIAEYRDASDRASGFTMTNYTVNMQVESKLKALKRPDLAAQVTKWLEDYRKEQGNNPMGGFGGPMGGGMPFSIPGQ